MKKFLIALFIAAVFVIHAGPVSTIIRTHTMLYPSVRLSWIPMGSKQWVVSGSGVIVKETDRWYYIITNKHVTDGDEEARAMSLKGAYHVFNYEVEDVGMAHIVAVAPHTDLALVKVAKGGRFMSVATLCSDEPSAFDKVFAVGAGLGREIAVSVGIVATPAAYSSMYGEDENEAYRFYMHTAPIFPGNSGGGLFVRYMHVNYCLAGLNDAVAVIPGGFSTQLLSTKAYALTLDTIKKFLSEYLP